MLTTGKRGLLLTSQEAWKRVETNAVKLSSEKLFKAKYILEERGVQAALERSHA